MDALLEMRLRITREYGAHALDLAIEHYRCAGCRIEVPGGSLNTIASSYEDLVGLVRQAVALTRGWTRSREELPSCPSCSRAASLEFLDYHAFHSGAQRDLVVRCAPPSGILRSVRHELFWWDPDGGYVAIQELSDEEESAVHLDALIRSATMAVEVSGAEAAGDALERLLEEAPAHPALMRFVQPLVAVGKTGLAGAIVEARLEAAPDDPEAHLAMAEIVIAVVNRQVWPVEKLSLAEDHLQRALALRASYPAAELAWSSLLRLRGDAAGARQVLTRLVTSQPDFPAARYNLGIALLDGDAEGALAQFARGEALAPDDPDYPLGRARALARLGRRSEAHEALACAERIAPEHPKLAQIRSELA